jgi:hypothetical protein
MLTHEIIKNSYNEKSPVGSYEFWLEHKLIYSDTALDLILDFVWFLCPCRELENNCDDAHKKYKEDCRDCWKKYIEDKAKHELSNYNKVNQEIKD